MDEPEPVTAREPEPAADVPTPDYLIRREPILSEDLGLAAYALCPVWPDGNAHDPATALIEQCHSSSPERFMGHLPHIIPASPALLMNAYAHALPAARVLLDIPAGMAPTPELLHNMNALARSGLKFILRSDLAGDAAYEPFIPFCRAVCFDLRTADKAALFRESFQHKQAGRSLWASHVPDTSMLDTCRMLGFNHFLGPQPRPPSNSAASLSTKQVTLLKLITLILGDGDGQSIKTCMEQDPELVQTLLLMVNTPAFGVSQKIESLNQAILLLGRRQLQRWVQVLMYTETGRPKGYLSPMLILASARGHLLESLAQREYPDQPTRSDTAFSVGALSVMDQQFGGTMRDLLAQITVDVPVRAALLEHSGPFSDDLKLAECVFPSSSEQAHDTAALLQGRHTSEINTLVQNAFEWSHAITQAA